MTVRRTSDEWSVCGSRAPSPMFAFSSATRLCEAKTWPPPRLRVRDDLQGVALHVAFPPPSPPA